MIEHIDSIAVMVSRAREWRREATTVGLVPTMGALHEGHLSLVRAARAACDHVVATIFVNPLQFGPSEDLDKYPRTFERDRDLLDGVGADLVFTTTPAEMYPESFSTHVDEDRLSRRLEGERRPGHFRGVLTVVAKLFHLTQPDLAFFGQKDAQQALLIRRMVEDLNFPIEVRIEPIVREPDGLAMSSRNRYLDADQRRRATSIHRALEAARVAHDGGERDPARLAQLARDVMEAEQLDVEYVEVVDPATLKAVERCERGLITIAARVGDTRLIDNHLLDLGGRS